MPDLQLTHDPLKQKSIALITAKGSHDLIFHHNLSPNQQTAFQQGGTETVYIMASYPNAPSTVITNGGKEPHPALAAVTYFCFFSSSAVVRTSATEQEI